MIENDKGDEVDRLLDVIREDGLRKRALSSDPTAHRERQRGRIVRKAFTLWYWVLPGGSRWMKVGPFWTQGGCRRAVLEFKLPCASGWLSLQDFEALFR